MNSALSSTTKSTSLSDDSSECNIVAKLRRLKIQEGLIIQNIKKSIPNLRDKESSITNINYKTESEYKEFISRIHNTYTEIINLFQSVKTSTSSRENLQTIDIDDVKNNVFELETKLKSFKIFLHSKLTSLKADEQELTKEMHMLTQQTTKTKISHKVSNKCYSDIIPSPVKIIINSPFKYTEVQKFQNFMSNYGRYGGWNEYNHNMFLLCWKKHFYTGKTIPKDMQYYNVKDHSDFISDLFEKNQDIKKDEIISHIEWYLQYLQLKNRQQKALEKWRDNRRKIKKFHNNLQNRKFKKQEGHSNVTNERICRKKLAEIQLSSDERVSEKTTNDNDILFENDCVISLYNLFDEKQVHDTADNKTFAKDFAEKYNRKDDLLFRLSKPTKQWKQRCTNTELNTKYYEINVINSTEKRGIPKWRLGLQYEL